VSGNVLVLIANIFSFLVCFTIMSFEWSNI
jgi:hypothetical protein